MSLAAPWDESAAVEPMIDSSHSLLRALADDLAGRLSPTRWDLTIEQALEALVRVTGDPALTDALRPVSMLLETTPSAMALDLAYGAPGAAADLEHACAVLAAEITIECGWLEEHPEAWAADPDEVRQVVTEFELLVGEVHRLARAAS